MRVQKYKIVNYVSQQVYECLEHSKKQKNLNSVPQTVNTILENYFNLNGCQTIPSDHLTQIVEELRNEVIDLKRQISQIQQNSTRECLNKSKAINSQEELLNSKQLATRLEVEETAIEQHKTDGKEFIEWSKSKDPERISWRYTGANLFERV